MGKIIAGVDEVGRGCVAGDVFVAAVILDEDYPIEGLKDSKQLSEKKRQFLAVEIKKKATSWAIARANVHEIDRLNILQASLLAMCRAVDQLTIKPNKVLVDGQYLPDWDYCSTAIVGGDNKEATIAAASIIAKVCRDDEMIRLGSIYPHYDFQQHKGYLTKKHRQALEKYGYCEIHRRSFKPISSLPKNECANKCVPTN